MKLYGTLIALMASGSAATALEFDYGGWIAAEYWNWEFYGGAAQGGSVELSINHEFAGGELGVVGELWFERVPVFGQRTNNNIYAFYNWGNGRISVGQVDAVWKNYSPDWEWTPFYLSDLPYYNTNKFRLDIRPIKNLELSFSQDVNGEYSYGAYATPFENFGVFISYNMDRLSNIYRTEIGIEGSYKDLSFAISKTAEPGVIFDFEATYFDNYYAQLGYDFTDRLAGTVYYSKDEWYFTGGERFVATVDFDLTKHITLTGGYSRDSSFEIFTFRAAFVF